MSIKRKAIEGDDFAKSRATEDDVEGHSMAARAVAAEDFAKSKAVEDDVEGHGLGSRKAFDVEGHHSAPKATEDDVEGHNIGVMNPILARELSRARERDVQREASRNSLIGEAKRALGRKR